jgi:hypothetical protein
MKQEMTVDSRRVHREIFPILVADNYFGLNNMSTG